MDNEFDHDVVMLKEWLRHAWRRISDPSITAYERREIRNYMKQAETALRSGLKQTSDCDRAMREASRLVPAHPRPEMRILQLGT
jgi:hypothetical protein